ncbi:DegT/DnrJ/EryC1/StrS aminotransferase family protein [Nocardia sp. 348MFTsu5.1]|uniref:DegT/DnrJ/EryC1/StrS family aminotransferase n=1 Tax=Nocardia sp. 348MFTsu5.1 TaxID=1172185 RepID=UPI000381AA40|nr:DegT/DnrJ/EryC1/StrS family aminotransferase [Nocardia sp. 348MFTsu5.1]
MTAVTRLNVMQPNLGEEEIAAVADVIESGWIAQGPRVAEFETRFAALVDTRNAVAVSNCTAALHLAMVVARVQPGDDVVVPSFSFVATANAPTYVGARPVFADVDPVTGNVTAETIENVLTPKTTAVIAVDQGGIPADIAGIRAVCEPRGITLVEDAACGAGSRLGNRPMGVSADIAVWSFHPRKLLTTGEGGMLTTNRQDWADRARKLREHGMSVSAAQRHQSVLAPAEQYLEVGFNYRMTDLQAAVGIVQLGRLAEMVTRRRVLAGMYQDALADVPGVRCVADPAGGRSNFQSFWIEVSAGHRNSREELLGELASAGISARRGIMAAHRHPAHAGRDHADLTVTERLTDSTLILPLFHQMTSDDLFRVVDVIRRS